MKVIMITGHAREGKTTLAEKIGKRFDIDCMALAGPLKEMTTDLFKLFGIKPSRNKELVRPYYQKIGTEICRRIFGDDIWCQTLEKNCENKDVVIVSDVRFPNEVEYFKSRYDTILIRVMNPYVEYSLNHSSEKYIDGMSADFVYEVFKDDEEERVMKYVKDFIES